MFAVLFCSLLLARPSHAQNLEWQWSTQSTGSGTTQVKNLAVDAAGTSCVVGFFTDTPNFGTTTLVSQGRSDLFVAKLSPAGRWQWAVAGGGSESDQAAGVVVDAAGRVFIAGSFSSLASFGIAALTSRGDMDVFVAEISTQGQWQWQWATTAGGTGTDRTCALTIDHAGELLVVGQFAETAAFGAMPLTSRGGTDAFVARLTIAGTWQWATPAGGNANDEATYSLPVPLAAKPNSGQPACTATAATMASWPG